ncbi:MAG: YfiM family protein [Chitinophagaceae bacterium]|nr:YfiM family protein [Chitinophagaceae bacterium]
MQYRLFAILSALFLLTIRGNAQAGDSIQQAPVPVYDSLSATPDNLQKPNPRRVALVAGVNVVAVSLSLALLNEVWYKNQSRGTFHFFNDSREWLQVDKFGHAWSAYNAAQVLSSRWSWAGVNPKRAALYGSLTSYAYLTGIEVLDGFAEKWGWSWSDVAANTVGIGLYLSQELAWQEQRIQYKFSFHTKKYREPVLQNRADDLFGSSFAERMLKDYNNQTYWFSANVRSFFPRSNWPAWLNVAVGYGADGMLGGFENKWEEAPGSWIDRSDIKRTRQFYLAPDIDFTRIPTKSRFLKTTFSILNSFKFPAPALMLNNRGKAKLYAFYF